MLSAGSVRGEFIIDDSQFTDASKRAINSSKNVEGSFGKMTKSVFTAQAMFTLASKALSGLINIGKQSITEFVNQEKAVAQLNATLQSTNNVIGMSSEELQKLAGNLQDTTTYADDAILGAENLLLTFTKIGKEVFPETTQAVLDMSTALGTDLRTSALQIGKAMENPIEGLTALQRVGVRFTDSQKDMIKTLVESGNQLDAQNMILDELQIKFGGSAVAVRDTFGGAMESLKNINGDILESFGMLISTIGRDFVEEMIKGSKAIRDWLNNAQNFAVLTDVIKGIFEGLKSPFEAINRLFKDLQGDTSDSNKELDILGGTLKVVSTLFLLTGKGIELGITFINDFINGIKNVGQELKELWNAITGKQSFEEAWNNIKDIDSKGWEDRKQLWSDFGNDFVGDVKNIWTQTDKEIEEANNKINYKTKKAQQKLTQTVIEETTERSKEQIKIEEETQKEQQKNLEEWMKIEHDISLESEEGKIKDIQERQARYLDAVRGNKEEEIKINQWAAEEIKKINQQSEDEILKTFSGISKSLAVAVTDTGNSLADGIGNVTNSIMNGMSSVMDGIAEMSDNMAKGILDTIAGVGEMVGEIYNSISEMQMDAMQTELETMQESNLEKVEELETNKEERLNLIQTEYDQKLEKLQSDLANGIITQQQFNDQKAIMDKAKADKEKATVKDMDDKIAEQKKDNRKKENEQKKKIFEAQKTNQIANIWIQTAIGVVSAFAGACQWPGVSMIAGLIFAGIMSALLIASAVAQTVVISQQTFTPEMALGGSLAAGESALVGERGAEIVTPNVSSYVTPNSITKSILENVGKSSGKQQNISVSFDGAQISNQMELEDVTDHVIMRLGQKLEMV